ncbi:hypothetical protein [Pilimelia terevasa]|nr:hypothetical protein [Pilimelia terevasa]
MSSSVDARPGVDTHRYARPSRLHAGHLALAAFTPEADADVHCA